jgi:hypothetical protein
MDADSQLAETINILTVKCAEDLVFGTHGSATTKRIVQTHAKFGLECIFERVPSPAGSPEYHHALVGVRERKT